MSKPVINPPKKKSKRSSDAGVSVTELLVVIVVIGVVSSFALASFLTAGKSAKLSGATRTLSTYLEKAHVDSVRRHGGASVNLNSATSYTVNIDFGTGSATARTITLPPGTSLQYSLPPATTSIDPATAPLTITYDWRGRAGSKVLITVTDSTTGVGSSTVSVGAVGDVSTDTTVSGPVSTPTPQTTVSTTAGIKSMNY
jgi:prepilin-type N-terminal cleavage/methylation domain-containing protein